MSSQQCVYIQTSNKMTYFCESHEYFLHSVSR